MEDQGVLDESLLRVERYISEEGRSKSEAKELRSTEENIHLAEVPCLCSKRWIMGYMGLLLGGCIYLLRVDFSMAMVCMVKPPETISHNSSNPSIVFQYGKYLQPLEDNSTSSSPITYPMEENRTIMSLVDIECRNGVHKDGVDQQNWEFTWSKSFQSLLLSIYYIGCCVSQVPGGWVANRFGGKVVITSTLVISCLCTLLTPVLARANRYLVIPLRLIMGLCTGPMMPAFYDLVGVWVPPFERSRFTSFMWIGQVLGAILAYSTSGLLCAHAPDNGWPSIFYIHGSVTLLFTVFWQALIADRPTKHRRISQAELAYIAKFVSHKTKKESRSVPWKCIFTSRAVWAINICHICDSWTFFTLLICLPMFLEEVLKLDVQKNGLYSSLPYVTFAVSLFVSSYTADILLSKQILTTTTVRRLYQIIAFLGGGVAICLSGFTTCNQHTLVIAYICLCNFFVGVGEGAGYAPNPVDIAPKYAGIIFSVSNTLAQIPGFVAPTVVGVMTANGTTEEWRNVFFICAGLNLIGILVFGCFSSGDVQSWSGTSMEMTITTSSQIKDKHLMTLLNQRQCDDFQHTSENGGVNEQNILLKSTIEDAL